MLVNHFKIQKSLCQNINRPNFPIFSPELNCDDLQLSAANVFHSITLGGNSSRDDSSYQTTTSQLERSEMNGGTGSAPLTLNYQFNQINTGICRDNIVLPRFTKEGSKRIRHYCILCKNIEQKDKSAKISKDVRQANITRHWQEVHSRHRRVREINSAATKLAKARLIKILQNEGGQYFNNILAEKEGKILNSRILNLILNV